VTPTGGWLLISEVMYDPFSLEPAGEWIELYNAGETAIDLSNYKVGDEVTQGNPEGMYHFPINATIFRGKSSSLLTAVMCSPTLMVSTTILPTWIRIPPPIGSSKPSLIRGK